MASKTMAARQAIQAKLKTVCDRVYYERANKDASFPFLTYALEELLSDYGTKGCALEVNAVDYGDNTSVCEELADSAQALLDKWYYLDDDVQFAVYSERRQAVQEDDKNIIRRRMTFVVRLHERS